MPYPCELALEVGLSIGLGLVVRFESFSHDVTAKFGFGSGLRLELGLG